MSFRVRRLMIADAPTEKDVRVQVGGVTYVVSDSSQMSNSRPRTMRRNAAMSGSTSSNANANARGRIVPSLSARLLPCVRVTVV